MTAAETRPALAMTALTEEKIAEIADETGVSGADVLAVASFLRTQPVHSGTWTHETLLSPPRRVDENGMTEGDRERAAMLRDATVS